LPGFTQVKFKSALQLREKHFFLTESSKRQKQKEGEYEVFHEMMSVNEF
jgi:hypothetical protein